MESEGGGLLTVINIPMAAAECGRVNMRGKISFTLLSFTLNSHAYSHLHLG